MRDYKKTIFLPTTSFPMKAGLKEKEPTLLARWANQNLYQARRAKSAGAPQFILHAGPPYANGHLHIGHGFNGILKDIVVRFQSLLGKDAPLVFGWDCHGLPIEWAVEGELRANKQRKDAISIPEFRALCRTFAQKWIDIQKNEFKRLGLMADFDRSYVTMDFASESKIAGAFLTFLEKGYVYKGIKPVLWSVVEQTALAEAEVDYIDKTSQSIYVRFPVDSTPISTLKGASILIWTTTPWTLPGNRAVAYGGDVVYVVLEMLSNGPHDTLKKGDRVVVAEDRLGGLVPVLGALSDDYTVIQTITGNELMGTTCRHPLATRHNGYDFSVPLLPAQHVTTDAGTGFVHTAPGHGAEDFDVGKAFNLEIPETVLSDGHYAQTVPLYAGVHVYKADPAVMADLTAAETLIHSAPIIHSYPHSWRSKAPLIFRTTPQWFIRVEGALRERALNAIDTVTWLPSQSQNRITGMVSGRGDWCVSRQRSWGVPIPLFINKNSGLPLIDPSVNKRIVAAFELGGCDCWFTENPSVFLGPDYDAADYDQVRDILDVWFESGASQEFVLKARPDLSYPADLYVEGSDQHRGWFQSSLLVSCALSNTAPFRAVLTHGFTVDASGRKMSKSLGNTISPESIIDTLGAEILRLWVVSCDYSDDLRIGPDLLKRQEDIYRRYRNTLRYLLGALDGFTPSMRVSYDALPELERYILSLLKAQEMSLTHHLKSHDYQGFFSGLHAFCSADLSAFYFDVRKDTLYCDSENSAARRGTLTVFCYLFESLVRLLSPVLCFTSEEAYLARHRDGADSIHLQSFDFMPDSWRLPDLESRWTKIRAERRVMTGALESARAGGIIGSSLQGALTVLDTDAALSTDVDWADLAIVSSVQMGQNGNSTLGFKTDDVPYLAVWVDLAVGDKCDRCWKILPDVGTNPGHNPVCTRCYTVLGEKM